LDSVTAIPSQRTLEECGRGVALFVGQDLDISQPGVVVDGDMHVLPAGATDTLAAIAVDPMSYSAGDSPQFLDIQVNQFAWPFAFVATCRLLRLQQGQALEARPPKDPGDGRSGDPQLLGNLWTGLAAPAKPDNEVLPVDRCLKRRPKWTGRTVDQTNLSLGSKSSQPLESGTLADASGFCGFADCPMLLDDPIDEQDSTAGGCSGKTVNVHPVLLSGLLTVWSPTALPKRTRMDNHPDSLNNVLRLHS